MRKLNSAQMLVFGSNVISEMERDIHHVVSMLRSHISAADLAKANLTVLDGHAERFETGGVKWVIYAVIAHKPAAHLGLMVMCYDKDDTRGNVPWYSANGGKVSPERTQEVYSSLPKFVDWMYERFPGLLQTMRPYLYAADTALAQEEVRRLMTR